MSTQNLIIINAGNFGREVYTWTQQAIQAGAPWVIRGFLDDRSEVLRGFRYSAPILSSVEDYQPSTDDLVISAVSEPLLKQHYCELLEARGARFAKLIHPTAVIGHDVAIGDGSIIGPLTQLSCDIRLGRHVTFGTNSNTAHDTRIGDFSHICGSCEVNGRAEIGERVFLGSHATILPRVRIGDDAYVGAGSVVLKNVKAGVKVFGNPAIPVVPVKKV